MTELGDCLPEGLAQVLGRLRIHTSRSMDFSPSTGEGGPEMGFIYRVEVEMGYILGIWGYVWGIYGVYMGVYWGYIWCIYWGIYGIYMGVYTGLKLEWGYI